MGESLIGPAIVVGAIAFGFFLGLMVQRRPSPPQIITIDREIATRLLEVLRAKEKPPLSPPITELPQSITDIADGR